MGLYSSLIERKFKNIAGKRYEKILREYREFLLTEEEMALPEIHSILMPLDRFVHDIPNELYETLSAYDATVTLVYIIDATLFSIIRETLSGEASEEFRKREEARAMKLLGEVSERLGERGLNVQRRLFFGDKSEDVIKLAGDHEMVVLSKSYGSEITKMSPISPVVFKIVQHVEKPVIVY